MLALDSPRIRFNHGYWDGRQDAWQGRPARTEEHGTPGPLPPDPDWHAYRAGYDAGYTCAARGGEYARSSEPAWRQFSRLA